MSVWTRGGATPVRAGSIVVAALVAGLRYYDCDQPVEIQIPPYLAN